ncbi:hypothetical protein HMPREF1142_1690 [Peptostreptococcaceae bacterium AS15]|nr:hypothetical protein HMPREF1142_1690 [Peptostreptococcaceae bacterium AS15]
MVFSITDTVTKIIYSENEITKDIDELIDRKNKMDKFIKSTLSGNEYIVIQMRYFNEYDWIEIAINLNYTIDNIYKIHGKALYKLRFFVNSGGVKTPLLLLNT